MKQNMPRTPFSTPLSRSAREVELRIQNIISGPRKRPPTLFLILVCAVCLLCGNLVSCQVAEKDVPDSSDPVSSVIPETSAVTREAYARVLEDMFDNGILPDGSAFEVDYSVESMADNQFAVADVDRDGYEELVIQFNTAITAGQRTWVLGYDMDNESVFIQFEGDRSLIFYDNGAIMDNDSHAQGSWTDEFWPYTLYRYLPKTDRYELAGHVGAWEKSVSDSNRNNIPAFPTEKDTSGAGILYYITPAEDLGENFTGYSKDPVDQSVYEEWLRPYLGDAQPINLEYQPLVQGNIELLRAERLAPSEEYPGLARTPDLNRNDIPEELRLYRLADKLYFEVWENGERIRTESGTLPLMESYWFNTNATALFLCTLEGRDYLLRAHADLYQGVGEYYWSLIDLSGEFEEWPRSGRLDVDLNFDAPHHKAFDPEEIAAYAEAFNELLSHSELLFNTCPVLTESFERSGGLEEIMPWLDDHPDVFTRDPEKSLLDNLKDFDAAMTATKSPAAGTPSRMPLTEPLAMRFSSGVGAWSTELTLDPDGTFTGLYVDADMGDDGEQYPNGTRYFCNFHGSFGDIVQLTDSSWSLTLNELVLDSDPPLGETDYVDGVRYISSSPYGFDGADGEPLKPGARFILYSPEAAGDAPGTELYGAIEFWTWWPDRHIFAGESTTLDCWGLHNLETGYGFFA